MKQPLVRTQPAFLMTLLAMVCLTANGQIRGTFAQRIIALESQSSFSINSPSPGTSFKGTAAKDAPPIRWQKCIGGKRDDFAYNVIKLSDGNYLTCGTTNSHDGDLKAVHGNYDAFLMKTDGAGNIIWEKTYGGQNAEGFQHVREASNGDLVAAGWTNSNDGQVSGNHSNDGSNDAWIIETNSEGKLLWQHCYGGSGDDYAVGVSITHHGSIVFSGLSSSNDGDVSNNHGDYDAWFVKLKPAGAIDFSVSIGDTGYDDFVDVAEIRGNYLAIGTTSKRTGDSAEPYYDAHAALFDQSGNIIFHRKYGGSSSDDGNALVTTQEGNAVLTGHVSSSDGDAIGNSWFNMWVWKIDVANGGNIIWQNHFGVLNEISASYDVIPTHDGGYVLVGGVAPLLFDPDHVEDALASKVNADGKALWMKRFGGSDADVLNGGIEEEDGSILATGATGSNDGVVSGNHGGVEDAWFVNLGSNCDNLSSAVKTAPVTLLKNYPNPFSASTTISFSLTELEQVSLKIYDVNGRLIETLADKVMDGGVHTIMWNARDSEGNAVSAGIYFLKAEMADKSEAIQLSVVK